MLRLPQKFAIRTDTVFSMGFQVKVHRARGVVFRAAFGFVAFAPTRRSLTAPRWDKATKRIVLQ